MSKRRSKIITDSLHIENARENNLKNLNFEIEHDQITAVTGLSGSGKSSLAFKTVYAEGQRRYIETFSPYTRQFLERVKKPEIDLATNVRPAIAIEQRTRVTNARSTVGSMTDVHDYLNVIWANLAKPVCPACSGELRRYSPEELASHLLKIKALKPDSTFLISAPIKISRGKLKAECERLSIMGISRFIDPQTGEVCLLEDCKRPKCTDAGELVVILDRIKTVVKKRRLVEAIGQAYALATGRCWTIVQGGGVRSFLQVVNDPTQVNRKPLNFSYQEYRRELACELGGITIERPRSALFSFNNPIGACPECKGFGRTLSLDRELCVPNPNKSIRDYAIAPWSSESMEHLYESLISFCKAKKISITRPWMELSEAHKELIFSTSNREFRGVEQWFKRLERKAYKMHIRVFLSKYRSAFPCASCDAKRLNPAALAYKIGDVSIADLWQMPIGELRQWLLELRASTTKLPRELVDVFSAIEQRLKYLDELGLSYLSLDRQARTLSGGETQRVNLATALGSELVSTHFVLDEPSVGLHPRDTERLIASVQNLSARGNSVLMVEHDLECIQGSDRVLEIGPAAGTTGGEVVFSGKGSKWGGVDLKSVEERLAAGPRKSSKSKSTLKVRGAQARNLKSIDIDIPLGRFVTLTGVSGSGKSTLVHEILKQEYDRAKIGLEERGLVKGFEKIEQLLHVDQSPLAKSPRANIATYTKIWEVVRTILSGSDLAKERSLSKSSFSFNVDAGRCVACKGAGNLREDMQFLSDVYIPCEICLGKRFQDPVLEVLYRGKNVDDFLNMSVDEAAEFFDETPSVRDTAITLSQLGLGHLRLGHSLSELSGGEAQRLKLVPFVQKSGNSSAFLIFDEPTTGLHTYDVERLIELFRLLRDKGHSVLCVEHNMTVVNASDWIIDLGPEGGDGGGELVKQGHPDSFAKATNKDSSYTARYLKQYRNSIGKTKLLVAPKGRAKKVSSLSIKGAKEHNLKNVSVDIPLGEMVALTGVSGSGKSSIAKDIIYAEGQRRYLDCLSPYARQFIRELKKPDIEEISNVVPTICVYQHTFQPSRRSTIGTMSEVYNHLRLLLAKTGVQYCPDHPNERISPLSADAICEIISKYKKSIRILAPVIKLKKGLHKTVFSRAIDGEIAEVRVDGVFTKPSKHLEGLERSKVHSIEFVIGRFNPKNMDRELIQETVATSLSIGGGAVIVHVDDQDTVFSLDRTCPICKKGFFKPDPEDLSFNSKRGRCSKCDGYGVASRGLSCKACEGTRINPPGRNLRLGGKNISELCSLVAPELKIFLERLEFNPNEKRIASSVLTELVAKLETLISVGLDYVPLTRDCRTLSSGELQRLRLGAAMGSPLSGVLYILDEPSAGLHPDDNLKVLGKLKSLKEKGNSVIIIEHDTESIRAADHVIDVGPGAGRYGGEIVFNGSLKKFIASGKTETSRALTSSYELPKAVAEKAEQTLKISGAKCNNIKNLSIELPLGQLVMFAGVSGAGKSSLMHGVIGETVVPAKRGSSKWKSKEAEIESSVDISKVLVVDQKPIGTTVRSTPASYLGIWDPIRKLFASTVEAKALGWTASHFSYNTGNGRCLACKGTGEVKLEMNFLADARVECTTCSGRRFSDETNSIKYLKLSVSDVLELTFEEAKEVFLNHRKTHQILRSACELGLGYIQLGQASSTLSGGESQRLKLVAELGATRRGHTLYLLDEPTTGLHRADVLRLVETLKKLVDRGNSVFVIEHDADLLAQSDYVVELGPGPAVAGGKVIFSGAPQDLLDAKTPWARILKNLA